MRKLLYTLAGLSALALFASCNKEAERPASLEGEVVTANFTVAAPEGVATKAISDGNTATNLIVAVYDEQGKYLKELSESATKNRVDLTWNVSMKVVKDMTYQFVFLAKKEAEVNVGFCHFDAANAKISIDYSAVPANSDEADFFFVQDQFKVENSFSKTEEMHRPLAQVNFGASDLAAAAYSINTETMLTGVKLTGIHSEMDVLTGNVTSTPEDVTFAQAARVDEGATEFAPNNKRIAMVYALVATDQANVTATLNVTAKGAKNDENHTITRVITNVPLKRNYRTNILGDIFTNDFNFTVNTVPGFDTPNYVKAYHWSFTSVAELNTFFADFAKYDAGDIDPELVTLTAISGDESTTITLPKSPKTITISMPFVTDKTITLKYADGAADSEKPNVDFYATNLAKLVTDIAHSHLTILTGSVIREGEFATSGSTLEIEEGAKVGTANIKRGNAAIAGAVENLNVMSGAVADEANNTVQVSLSRDAAVSVITLDAKADVVVVQPKGNIDAVHEENGDNRIEVKVIIKSTASESTATAKDGGSIYVVSEAEVASVAAVGKSEADNTESSVIVAAIPSDGVIGADDNTEGGNNITVSDNAEAGTAEKVKDYVAAIGDAKYLTIADAFDEAVAGDTVLLLVDQTLTSATLVPGGVTFSIPEGLTLDGEKKLFVLGALDNAGTVNCPVDILTEVYTVERQKFNDEVGSEYAVKATYNGTVSHVSTLGQAPKYHISLDDGQTWFEDTNNGATIAVRVDTSTGNKSLKTSLAPGFLQNDLSTNNDNCIYYLLKDATTYSTNNNKNYGPMLSYCGFVFEGNGHTIKLTQHTGNSDYSSMKLQTLHNAAIKLNNLTIDSSKLGKYGLDIVPQIGVIIEVYIHNFNAINNKYGWGNYGIINGNSGKGICYLNQFGSAYNSYTSTGTGPNNMTAYWQNNKYTVVSTETGPASDVVFELPE